MGDMYTLEALLKDFRTEDLQDGDLSTRVRDGTPITIWLPRSVKRSYDELQAASNQQLSKKIRQAVITIVDLAKKKVQLEESPKAG